ncbi:hypothetical protein LL912_24890 [Niabella sp. CC-SYL272]|uniref:hypothetical protein n=1 Tax=Niabella agricola TaxID=2891571 RepID=UPI001F1A687D|nr:hypothetical protein [Niabella agricola]MCF3112048.1 hypothetical protein [Niabella agricola]
MKMTSVFIALLFAANALIAQSGKALVKVRPVKPVILNHGTVVRTVAHTTHDGRLVSRVASSKSNGKKNYNKIHYKRKYPVAPKKATKFVP